LRSTERHLPRSLNKQDDCLLPRKNRSKCLYKLYSFDCLRFSRLTTVPSRWENSLQTVFLLKKDRVGRRKSPTCSPSGHREATGEGTIVSALKAAMSFQFTRIFINRRAFRRRLL
jgi:hypothetical protein